MSDAPPRRSSPELGYVGLALDRCAERRDDEGFIADQRRSTAARFVLFAGDKAVLRPVGGGVVDAAFDASGAEELGAKPDMVYLGRVEGAPVFAGRLGEGAETALTHDENLVIEDVRALAMTGRLAGPALALVGYAKSLTLWHQRHGFCANCGSATAPSASGWRRQCANCGTLHFPRFDPVVIMLVTRGDRCLLGRQPRFPPNMWSCLAGFVEPGETIEAACRREILEEAGVTVGAVGYAFSQPWPFPSQLMIGLLAEGLSEEITPDLEELEDVRWFPREEAAAMLARAHPDGLFGPHPTAIAHHLLRRFVEG